jgi:hypothetical protein
MKYVESTKPLKDNNYYLAYERRSIGDYSYKHIIIFLFNKPDITNIMYSASVVNTFTQIDGFKNVIESSELTTIVYNDNPTNHKFSNNVTLFELNNEDVYQNVILNVI